MGCSAVASRIAVTRVFPASRIPALLQLPTSTASASRGPARKPGEFELRSFGFPSDSQVSQSIQLESINAVGAEPWGVSPAKLEPMPPQVSSAPHSRPGCPCRNGRRPFPPETWG
eukprot:13159647-Alexandrium_andersonii.AAC.1